LDYPDRVLARFPSIEPHRLLPDYLLDQPHRLGDHLLLLGIREPEVFGPREAVVAHLMASSHDALGSSRIGFEGHRRCVERCSGIVPPERLQDSPDGDPTPVLVAALITDVPEWPINGEKLAYPPPRSRLSPGCALSPLRSLLLSRAPVSSLRASRPRTFCSRTPP